jgi:hypothetical protein
MDGRKETVEKAVSFKQPERVPLLFAYSLDKSDVINIPVVNHFLEGGKSEWGFEWEHLDNALLMGQPKKPLITDYAMLDDLPIPDPKAASRFAKVAEIMNKYGNDRYYKASFILSGFAIITMLRGFSSVMEDFYMERDNLEKLCGMVFGFENEVIRQCGSYGFSAIGLADDWGTQTSLMISPDLWREMFKPRYKEQIDLAHRMGMHVYMHSCGYIFDIIEDLIDIGLDIINPGQPDINDVPRMGELFGARICFACPPSYQTTGISGNADAIASQIRQYKRCLAKGGGLIGIRPEDSAPLGISGEMFQIMENTFKEESIS